MGLSELFSPETYAWVVLPLLIFCARICDVTLGTIRIISVSKGRKSLAALLGFLEVLIWIITMGQIMNNLSNPAAYIAYAGGFAMGNFVGISIEERLAIGELVVRVITSRDGTALVGHLRAAGYGATSVAAEGATGPVNIIYTIIKRSALPEVCGIIRTFNPHAFYSVEDVRSVNAGVFPPAPSSFRKFAEHPLHRLMRK